MKWKRMWSREYSVQYCEAALLAIGKGAERLLSSFISNAVIVPENKNECCYFAEEDERKFLGHLVDSFTGSPKTFRKFVELFYSLGTAYVDFSKSIAEQDLRSKSAQELLDFYQEYYKHYLEYSSVLWAGHLLNEYWAEQGSALKIEDDTIRGALFSPVKKSTILLMQEEARKLRSEEELQEFWRKYQWLPCLDVHNTPWTLEDAQDYVKSIAPVRNETQLSFAEAVQRAGLSKQQEEMFQMIKELGYIKDVRDDFRRQGVFYIQELYKEIARRMNLTLQDVAYVTFAEICEFLEKGKECSPDVLLERKQGFAMYLDKDEVILIENDIEKVLQEIGFVHEQINNTVVSGLCAHKGKVKGNVVIVYTVHDILKVKKGDILVAVTTHPDYVPAMQKAAAIVTDEGGLLSHAAIVSRELGKPCIVNTKNGTKILPHGSVVEVDAEKGVVKVVK